jgi:hypothetical protein
MGLEIDAAPERSPARWRARRPAWLRIPAPVSLAQSQRTLPWRVIFAQAASIWLATRIAYAILTWYLPLAIGGQGPSTHPFSLYTLIRRWTYWDGHAYIVLAQGGYNHINDTVYFPLFPGLIKIVSTLIGSHWITAALLISNLAALLAYFGVAALAAQIAPAGRERRVARTAVLLFATYPLGFFLVAAYSDGLFAGLAALTLLFSMRRDWRWAAAVGILAGLCRPVAPALILPLAWEALQRYRELRAEMPTRQALRQMAPAVPAVLGPIIGIGLYACYLWLRFGSPFTFVLAESHWAHFFLLPLFSIPVAIVGFFGLHAQTTLQMRVFLDLAPIVAAVILTFAAIRRAPVAFTLYMLCLLFLVTSEPIDFTDLFISGGRYMIAAAPLFVIFADRLTRSEWLLPILLWSGALLQALLAIYFLQYGWIV